LISSTTRGNKKVDRETDSRYVDRRRIHWKKTYRQPAADRSIDGVSTVREFVDLGDSRGIDRQQRDRSTGIRGIDRSYSSSANSKRSITSTAAAVATDRSIDSREIGRQQQQQ
jgi:hypothetical protein